MKKVISCVLVLMLLMSLTACVELVEVEQPNANQNGETNVGVQELEKQESAQAEATIEELVLLDEKDVKIIAKKLSYDSLFGPEIKVLIENNSTQNLTIQTRGSSVNGYMVETMFSPDVAAGKKANESITLLAENLEACGIDTIADIEFSFHIFKTDNWDTYLDSDPVVLKTSAAEGYTYTYNQEGTMVYDDKNVKIVFKELGGDSILGPELVMYIHNAGDKSVTVQTREVSINGFMIDPIFSAEVGPGKHAVSGVTFMSSDLEENEIEKITDAEMSFHIFNTETWNTIADTDTVTLSFS